MVSSDHYALDVPLSGAESRAIIDKLESVRSQPHRVLHIETPRPHAVLVNLPPRYYARKR